MRSIQKIDIGIIYTQRYAFLNVYSILSIQCPEPNYKKTYIKAFTNCVSQIWNVNNHNRIRESPVCNVRVSIKVNRTPSEQIRLCIV